jgi:hypothetical protein
MDTTAWAYNSLPLPFVVTNHQSYTKESNAQGVPKIALRPVFCFAAAAMQLMQQLAAALPKGGPDAKTQDAPPRFGPTAVFCGHHMW